MDKFQGKVDTILEYLHTQKVVTISVFVETLTENASQPVPNQSGFILGPSGHVVVYPRGRPLNFNPQIANGGAFIPYQPMSMHTINGNYIAYL